MTRQVTLSVNDTPIPLDYFVEGFVDHTVGGMLAALEGTGEVENLDFTIEGDKVAINLNGAAVPINQFVNKITRSTVIGMVSTLKGVGQVSRLRITVKR